jgi:hypothetical protein
MAQQLCFSGNSQTMCITATPIAQVGQNPSVTQVNKLCWQDNNNNTVCLQKNTSSQQQSITTTSASPIITQSSASSSSSSYPGSINSILGSSPFNISNFQTGKILPGTAPTPSATQFSAQLNGSNGQTANISGDVDYVTYNGVDQGTNLPVIPLQLATVSGIITAPGSRNTFALSG